MNWRCEVSSDRKRRSLLLLIQPLLFLAVPVAAAQPRLVHFKTADGWTIAAIYREPAKGMPAAVFIHGVAAGKEEWSRLTDALGARGWGTLAIDLRGHGGSTQGPSGRADYRGFDASGEWPRAAADVEGALAYLRARKVPASRAGLIGASIGANLVSRLAGKAAWVVLLSPGADYRGVELASAYAGRPVLAAASPGDAYAFRTAVGLAGLPDGPVFLQARAGHGAQMLEDPAFLEKLLGWLETR